MLFCFFPITQARRRKNNLCSNIDNVWFDGGEWQKCFHFSSFELIIWKEEGRISQAYLKGNEDQKRSQILEISSSWIQIRQKECVIFRKPETCRGSASLFMILKRCRGKGEAYIERKKMFAKSPRSNYANWREFFVMKW